MAKGRSKYEIGERIHVCVFFCLCVSVCVCVSLPRGRMPSAVPQRGCEGSGCRLWGKTSFSGFPVELTSPLLALVKHNVRFRQEFSA